MNVKNYISCLPNIVTLLWHVSNGNNKNEIARGKLIQDGQLKTKWRPKSSIFHICMKLWCIDLSYLEAANLTIRPINQITIDLIIQNTMKKTPNPAKIVSKGGPCAPASESLDVFPPDFSSPEGLEFDACAARTLRAILILDTRYQCLEFNSE